MKKFVLITGASGGIGSAIAKTFAIKGYGVIIHYNSNKESAEKLCKLLTDNGCDAVCVKADLTSPEDICRCRGLRNNPRSRIPLPAPRLQIRPAPWQALLPLLMSLQTILLYSNRYPLLLYMFVRKQVILTIFIIAIAP